jgi:hypothetical protein
MFERIAIAFRSRRQQESSVVLVSQLEHVPASRGPGFERFDRVIQILRGTRERSQVQHSVNRAGDVDGSANIVLNKLERVFVQQMLYIFEMAGDQVVESDDFMPSLDQTIAQV